MLRGLTWPLKLLHATNNVMLGCCMLISTQLWLNNREFPILPAFEKLPLLPRALDTLVFVCLFVLLVISSIRYSRWVTLCLLALLAVELVEDQMRWQPWVYQFILFTIPFCVAPRQLKKLFPAYFQIILIGTYLWSGIHKLNSKFAEIVFPGFAKNMFGIDLHDSMAGYVIPVLEILIAIGLLIPWSRKHAVIAGAIMHITILAWLTPYGGNINIVIIPWNIAMVVLLYLCFYNVKVNEPLISFTPGQYNKLKLGILIPAFILPIFNLFGSWDHYLSFNLYSGKNAFLFIAVEESQLQQLPYSFNGTFLQIPGLEGGKIIDANRWALQEVHVFIPPESRLYDKVAKHFCDFGIAADKIMILEFEQPVSDGKYKSYPCNTIPSLN